MPGSLGVRARTQSSSAGRPLSHRLQRAEGTSDDHDGPFHVIDTPGPGPFLHQHPYSETFVMHSGKALFTVAGQQLVGEGGMVLVVPELTPHKFEVIGPERYRSVHIHASDTFITDWLEGPQGSEDLDAVLGLSAPRRREEVLALNSADPEDAGPRGGQ